MTRQTEVARPAGVRQAFVGVEGLGGRSPIFASGVVIAASSQGCVIGGQARIDEARSAGQEAGGSHRLLLHLLRLFPF
ncbi:MAG TPA: hypothetical protein VII47_06525, partial [Actinomycetota bacterium]